MADKKLALNIQIPAETDKYLQEIIKQTGYTKTQVVILLIAREYERRKRENDKDKERDTF